MGSYADMRMRVVNAAPCEVRAAPFVVRIVEGRPTLGGSWPGSVLLLGLTEDGEQAFATFGDLTVPVTLLQALELVLLAGGAQGIQQFLGRGR